MKKNIATVIIVLILAICIVAFSACDEKATLVVGESAYDIAVDNGFTGTEQEWLASLQGENGTDGKDGVDGAYAGQGYSAYEIAVQNGFTGTIAEWLESLQGERGDAGASSVSAATNQAIVSIVSVTSNFTRTVTSYNPFNKTYSSTDQNYSSAGAGVIISDDKENGDAYIVTNYHVVYDADANSQISGDISVFLYGMEYAEYKIPVVYVGGSMTYDIAVLKIENSDTYKNSGSAACVIGSSGDIVAGDTAIAIGNPAAAGISATSGIVSIDSEYITMTAADDQTEVTFRVMRIDAAINGGNSGGGLFNDEGELIGITNAKIVSEEIEGIAYAIPSDLAITVANNIIRNCNGTTVTTPQRCILGIGFTIDSSRAEYDSETSRTKVVESIKVTQVVAGSAAEAAGLQVDDIMLYFTYNGKIVNVTRSFTTADYSFNFVQGDTVTLTVLCGGVQTDVAITVPAPTSIA